MVIFTEPIVFLLARPKLDKNGIQEFIKESGNIFNKSKTDKISDGDAISELGGRVCYCSFKSYLCSGGKFLKRAILNNHGSIFEHANYTFGVARCSRGYTHQMVRHRAGFAYSQESTHYIKYSKATMRACVDKYAIRDGGLRRWENGISSILDNYEILCSSIGSKNTQHFTTGAARQLLPQAIESKLIFTANIRALRHFIEERCNRNNTLEIRLIAKKIFQIMVKEAPWSMYGIQLFTDVDNEKSIKSQNKKI